MTSLSLKRSTTRLPDDYRHFITEIGNGGSVPYYGMFPLGYMDDAFDVAPWDKPYSIVGELAAEFPIVRRGTTLRDARPMNSPIRMRKNTSGSWVPSKAEYSRRQS